jgi:hypothetical protein
MSQNYGRACTIVAGGTTYVLVEGVGPPIGLRGRFSVKLFADGLTLNKAVVRISNPLPATAQQFVTPQAEGLPLTITAGYTDNSAIIFSGFLRQAIYGRDSPTDTVLTLIGADTDKAHNYGTISQTLAAGSTPMDQINAAVTAMAKAGQIAVGYLDPALNLLQPVFPRAVALYGMGRDVLLNVAKSKQANVSYQQGQVQMLGAQASIPGSAFVLNTNTGLVGMPTQTVGGIMARILINPSVKINTSVQIAQSLVQGAQLPLGPDGNIAPNLTPNVAADGFYKVLGIDFDGDTRGNPWYMDLACISVLGVGGNPSLIPRPLLGAAAGPPV